MSRVCWLYALSGFVSLGYQVAWFRIYVDRLGASSPTFALVLCNFIAGLGVGSLCSRTVSDVLARFARTNDRLRVYGAVELMVAASIPLTILAGLLPGDMFGAFPYELREGLYRHNLGYQVANLAIGSICVFVPSLLMGVTFPLLCQVFLRSSRFPSSLYAWNTLGACTGVLACQFALLPTIGHDATLILMAGINAVIGGYFVVTGGAPEAVVTEPPSSAMAVPGATSLSAASSRSKIDLPEARVLFTCAVTSGLVAGALEGDLYRRIQFVGAHSAAAMSLTSFWAILAIFLASATVRRFGGLRLLHVRAAYVLAFAYFLLAWQMVYPFEDWLVQRAYAPVIALGDTTQLLLHFPTSLGQLLVFVGVLVFPSFYLISLLLPYVCNRLQLGGHHLGLAYGVNTIAFCLGMIAFTWGAPRVSAFFSMKLMVVVLAAAALLLQLLSERKPIGWRVAIAVAVIAGGVVLTPTGFDARFLAPGSAAARFPVRALKSNGAHTTYVVADPAGDRLFFDSYSMSTADRNAQTYMRLMAHLPLLAQERPQSALLICFGVGNTAAAIATHDSIEVIDVVELNDRVVETAPEFGATNGRVYDDPRVRFIHDDGRNYLRLTDRMYDLVTSEPPPPMHPGIYRLYSAEYYADVLAHLTAHGIMSQWLPAYQMPGEAIALAVQTFASVFPQAMLVSGYGNELLLLGGHEPFDLRRLETRFNEAEESVRIDLRRVGVRGAIDLLSRVMMTDSMLRGAFPEQRVLSDQHNHLANLFIDPARPAAVPYRPLEVLEALAAVGLVSYPELEAVVTHLGRSRYHAKLSPDSLTSIQADDAPRVTLADVDWTRVNRLERGYEWALTNGQVPRSIELLERILAIAPQQPHLLLDLGRLYMSAGRHAEAEARFREVVSLEPDDGSAYAGLGAALTGRSQTAAAIEAFRVAINLDPFEATAHVGLGNLLALGGEIDEAVRHYEQAVRARPRWPTALNALAWIFATHPDVQRPIEAVGLAERAVELSGRKNAVILKTLAVALAAAGETERAEATAREVSRIAR